ncbi:MAG: hypothetical protein J5997_11730 [Oscillospiraceae bacterium]|nr:hypothetical protein [Oscillospiraceae bacterium]
MNIKKLALIFCAVILATGCSDTEHEDTGPDLKPYMIKAGNKEVNLLDSSYELQEQLGKKFSTETLGDQSSVIVCASYHENFDGFTYSDFHPVYDKENKNRKKFALYNGINVDSDKDTVEKQLGSCMKFEGEYTQYIELFINGEEIDYSLVDTSEFSDTEDEIVRYSQAARAYCAKQLENEESGNYVVINVSCYDSRDNDISVSILQK